MDQRQLNSSLRFLKTTESKLALREHMRSVFAAAFPDSIMSTSDNLEDLGVSCLTAHCVGWNQISAERVAETRKYSDCQREIQQKLLELVDEERQPRGDSGRS